MTQAEDDGEFLRRIDLEQFGSDKLLVAVYIAAFRLDFEGMYELVRPLPPDKQLWYMASAAANCAMTTREFANAYGVDIDAQVDAIARRYMLTAASDV